jgi:hypothetical protein
MTSQEKFTCTTEEYQCTSPGTRVLIAQGDLIREEREREKKNQWTRNNPGFSAGSLVLWHRSKTPSGTLGGRKEPPQPHRSCENSDVGQRALTCGPRLGVSGHSPLVEILIRPSRDSRAMSPPSRPHRLTKQQRTQGAQGYTNFLMARYLRSQFCFFFYLLRYIHTWDLLILREDKRVSIVRWAQSRIHNCYLGRKGCFVARFDRFCLVALGFFVLECSNWFLIVDARWHEKFAKKIDKMCQKKRSPSSL